MAQVAFFDHFLKGEDNGWERTAPVRLAIHERGPNPVAVLGEPSGPPPDLTWETLYLDLAGSRLTDTPSETAETAGIDLRDGMLSLTWRAQCAVDVIGHAALRLWVSLDGTADAHLFVGVRKFRQERECLFEGSYGFGFDMVTRGWQRVTHRELDQT